MVFDDVAGRKESWSNVITRRECYRGGVAERRQYSMMVSSTSRPFSGRDAPKKATAKTLAHRQAEERLGRASTKTGGWPLTFRDKGGPDRRNVVAQGGAQKTKNKDFILHFTLHSKLPFENFSCQHEHLNFAKAHIGFTGGRRNLVSQRHLASQKFDGAE